MRSERNKKTLVAISIALLIPAAAPAQDPFGHITATPPASGPTTPGSTPTIIGGRQVVTPPQRSTPRPGSLTAAYVAAAAQNNPTIEPTANATSKQAWETMDTEDVRKILPGLRVIKNTDADGNVYFQLKGRFDRELLKKIRITSTSPEAEVSATRSDADLRVADLIVNADQEHQGFVIEQLVDVDEQNRIIKTLDQDKTFVTCGRTGRSRRNQISILNSRCVALSESNYHETIFRATAQRGSIHLLTLGDGGNELRLIQNRFPPFPAIEGKNKYDGKTVITYRSKEIEQREWRSQVQAHADREIENCMKQKKYDDVDRLINHFAGLLDNQNWKSRKKRALTRARIEDYLKRARTAKKPEQIDAILAEIETDIDSKEKTKLLRLKLRLLEKKIKLAKYTEEYEEINEGLDEVLESDTEDKLGDQVAIAKAHVGAAITNFKHMDADNFEERFELATTLFEQAADIDGVSERRSETLLDRVEDLKIKRLSFLGSGYVKETRDPSLFNDERSDLLAEYQDLYSSACTPSMSWSYQWGDSHGSSYDAQACQRAQSRLYSITRMQVQQGMGRGAIAGLHSGLGMPAPFVPWQNNRMMGNNLGMGAAGMGSFAGYPQMGGMGMNQFGMNPMMGTGYGLGMNQLGPDPMLSGSYGMGGMGMNPYGMGAMSPYGSAMPFQYNPAMLGGMGAAGMVAPGQNMLMNGHPGMMSGAGMYHNPAMTPSMYGAYGMR